jgi:hypothetical protein
VHDSHDELQRLDEFADSLQPFLSEDGAASITQDNEILTRQWQDLDTDVAQAVNEISSAYDVSAKLHARIGAFEARLHAAENDVVHLKQFNTDQLESAESSVRVGVCWFSNGLGLVMWEKNYFFLTVFT